MTKPYDNIQQIVSDDPDWAAFLYLTDELATSDVELFEDMLAEQDDLQVALINATRLMATVTTTARTDADATACSPTACSPTACSPTAAIAPQAISRADRRKRQSVFINVCCLTLCVLVGAVSIWDRMASRAANEFEITAALDAEIDAMFGVEDGDGDEDVEAEQELLTAWVDIQPDIEGTNEEDVYSDSDLDVPDWMLTAVLLDEQDAGLEVSPSGDNVTPLGRSESI